MSLLLMFAEIMPEEAILEEIESSVLEYKLTKNPETKKRLQMFCALLSAKHLNEQNGVENNMVQMKEMERIHERMNSVKSGQ